MLFYLYFTRCYRIIVFFFSIVKNRVLLLSTDEGGGKSPCDEKPQKKKKIRETLLPRTINNNGLRTTTRYIGTRATFEKQYDQWVMVFFFSFSCFWSFIPFRFYALKLFYTSEIKKENFRSNKNNNNNTYILRSVHINRNKKKKL